MKSGILIITLTLLTGLLMFSQAVAAGQGKMGGAQSEMGQSGMQTMEPSQTQQQMQTKDQLQLHQQTATHLLNQEQIREMQRLLNQNGYAIKNMNGTIDQETTSALRHYQESEKLTVTGTPNRETLRALAPNNDQQEFFGLAPKFSEPIE